MSIIKRPKGRYKIWFGIIIIGIVCLFYFNTIAWAFPVTYGPGRATLAAQSIFKPIMDTVRAGDLSRSMVELTLVVDMALKGLKGEDEETALKYRSRLDINAALDKQYDGMEEEKIFEVLSNPKILEDGAIEIDLRATVAEGERHGFSLIFNGNTIDDMLDRDKIEVEPVNDKGERKRYAKDFDYTNVVPGGVGDVEEYGGLIESVFDGDESVTDFVREQASIIERSHYSYVKAENPSELYSYLGVSVDPDHTDSAFETETKKTVEEYFSGRWTVKPFIYASRSIEGGNEYIWLCFLQWETYDGRIPGFKGFFYVNGEKIAHDFSVARGNKMCDMAMGIDMEYWKHKGHMQVLFKMKHSLLKQEFNPIFFRAYKGQVLTGFDALFFYLRRGYLPLDPDARKTVIDKFLKPWLESGKKLRVKDPHLLFDDDFFESCGDFVLATRDPRAVAERVMLPEEESPEKISLTEDITLLNRAARHLKGYPVDMIIDLSLIPKEDADANMRTWAYLMMLHNKHGLDVNYIFEPGEDKQHKIDSMRMLVRHVRDIAAQQGIDGDEILERVNKRHDDPRTLEVHIMKLKDLEEMQTLPENMLPVAMSEGKTRAGVPLRDFTAASAIGIAQAACRKAQKEDEEHPEKEPALPRVIKEIFPKIREIYKRLLPEEMITEETLANMIDNSPTVRKNLAIALALPPIVRIAVDQLKVYHERMQLLLQAA